MRLFNEADEEREAQRLGSWPSVAQHTEHMELGLGSGFYPQPSNQDALGPSSVAFPCALAGIWGESRAAGTPT